MNPKIDLHLNPKEYVYDMQELIDILLDVKKQGEGSFNFPKAFLTLAFYLQNTRRLIGLIEGMDNEKLDKLYSKLNSSEASSTSLE